MPGGTVAYIGDTEDKFLHLDVAYLDGLGVVMMNRGNRREPIFTDDQDRETFVRTHAQAYG